MLDLPKLRSAIKAKDGWWASIFAGPLANRLLQPICEIIWISPNLITVCSFMIGVLAALCFLQGSHVYLTLGGLLVQLSFVVDCMDGQLARYRQEFSNLGAWLDRVCDRIKDFLYFFTLAFGFFVHHKAEFQYTLSAVNYLLGLCFSSSRDFFLLSVDLQALLMRSISFPTWIIWPLAMIAMFSIFLIDYYVNQDMKLSPATKPQDPNLHKKNSRIQNPIFFIFHIGKQIYQQVPILRFNIGEQALLISLFCILNAPFSLCCFFALLGVFYSLYWPLAKLYGFLPKDI